MAPIRFLVDENVPRSVSDFLRARGHDVFSVGEVLAKGSPDLLLMVVAEQQGFVVITFDKDFKRLIQHVQMGRRGQFERRAGRFSLRLREDEAAARIEATIATIEHLYAAAQAQDTRLIMQISATSITVSM